MVINLTKDIVKNWRKEKEDLSLNSFDKRMTRLNSNRMEVLTKSAGSNKQRIKIMNSNPAPCVKTVVYGTYISN